MDFKDLKPEEVDSIIAELRAHKRATKLAETKRNHKIEMLIRRKVKLATQCHIKIEMLIRRKVKLATQCHIKIDEINVQIARLSVPTPLLLPLEPAE